MERLNDFIMCRSNKAHNGSGRYFKNRRSTQENESPSYKDDRSSPSGQSDQASDSTFKSRHPTGRVWSGSAASRATNKARQSVLVKENGTRKVSKHFYFFHSVTDYIYNKILHKT